MFRVMPEVTNSWGAYVVKFTVPQSLFDSKGKKLKFEMPNLKYIMTSLILSVIFNISTFPYKIAGTLDTGRSLHETSDPDQNDSTSKLRGPQLIAEGLSDLKS